MTLSLALQNARASLSASSLQSALVSRNVASAGETGYQRRVATLISSGDGIRLDVNVTRLAADDLRDSALGANSSAERSAAFLAGITDLARTDGDPTLGTSLADAMTKLRDALDTHAAQPSNAVLAGQVLSAAQNLSQKLNAMSTNVSAVRVRADQDIAASAQRVNDLLGQFQDANTRVVAGLGAGRDISASQDQRDRILAQLSTEMGVVVRPQRDGGLAVFTDGGAVLFDREPRAVKFAPSLTQAPGGTGGALFVDGVDVTSQGSTMPLSSGRLAGLFDLRDHASLTYQTQIDEAARGLIGAFAERDQGAPATLPDLPGLFTYQGATSVPAPPAITGLAGRIKVNPNADPAKGGSLLRIRDGGISDPANPAYVYNKQGLASYATRIGQLAGALETARAYDSASSLAAQETPLAQAASSLSWISSARSNASGESDRLSTLRDITNQTLSNATGVNVDDEMAHLLEIERTYQASAKLISTVDQMFGSLLQAVG